MLRRNPKISGTTHNVFGIQTGVAVAFFVRKSRAWVSATSRLYASRDDAELAKDKLAYLFEGHRLDKHYRSRTSPDCEEQLAQPMSNSNFAQLVHSC